MNSIERIKLLSDMIKYNLKIVFANKFVYFLTTAVIFYLVIVGINLFSDFTPSTADIYYLLMFPGILIMFYPIVYNIQNDKDTRILEILFGIPNYRYKIYMVRFAITLLMLFVMLCLMGWFAVFAIARIPVIQVAYQLMYPMFFIACLTLLFSTLTRNGNGTAVIMVILGLLFWILSEPLARNKWNLFINPFKVPDNINLTIWMKTIAQNRMILMIGSVVCILWSLINMQRREKFV